MHHTKSTCNVHMRKPCIQTYLATEKEHVCDVKSGQNHTTVYMYLVQGYSTHTVTGGFVVIVKGTCTQIVQVLRYVIRG